MVIKSNNVTGATIDVTSLRDSIKDIASPSTASSYDIKEKISLMQEYFSTLNGTDPHAFEKFEPVFRRIVHPSIVVESDEHPDMHYDNLLSLVRDKFLPSGCVSELLDTIDNGDGTVTNVVNNHLPGESGDITRQRAFFGEDGRVIRVSTKSKFGDMIDRVTALTPSSESNDIDVVVDRYQSFLLAFDGSDKAPSKTDALYDGLFHEEFVFVTEEGEKNLTFFKAFTQSTARTGQRVEIESVKAVGPDKISISFHVMKENSSVLVERIATLKDGKVIRSGPLADNDTAFTHIRSRNEQYE